MSDLHSLPLSELLALAGRAVAAEAQLEQIRAAVGTAGRGSTSPAPSRPRRAACAEPPAPSRPRRAAEA